MAFILSSIATVLGLIEPFNKKMKTILIFNFIGNLLVGVSYLLNKSFSGAAICAVACTQVFINYNFDAKQKKVPLWLIIIYGVAFLGVNLLAFAHWYDILSLLAAMVFVISVAQSDAKYYRILYMTNSFLWIGYDLLAKAYGPLSTHIILFIATTVSIIIRDKKR